ncbi:MAG: PilZ domain-containing protein [Lachnospiraceae bacterium]|nr:PilZ domain-containing protein [Lachnospiraceae bacterium]
MGIKLSTIETGSPVTLIISNKEKAMTMEANIKRFLKDDIALIAINLDTTQTLNFENVHIELEYSPEDGIPYVWRNVQIIYYQSEYILKTLSDGVKNNRRNSFRVGVGRNARMTIPGHGTLEVLVRDVSISGFSITDRRKELNLHSGDMVSIHFEDIGHILDLSGKVVRIEEHEEMIVYGFQITNLCKDLASYVTIKQRRKNS